MVRPIAFSRCTINVLQYNIKNTRFIAVE